MAFLFGELAVGLHVFPAVSPALAWLLFSAVSVCLVSSVCPLLFVSFPCRQLVSQTPKTVKPMVLKDVSNPKA